MLFTPGLPKTVFFAAGRYVFDGLRSDVESGGIILAGLDHLHTGGTVGQHVADVAISALPAGGLFRAAVIDCAQFVGFMHLWHLVIVLLNLNAGAMLHGKQ